MARTFPGGTNSDQIDTGKTFGTTWTAVAKYYSNVLDGFDNLFTTRFGATSFVGLTFNSTNLAWWDDTNSGVSFGITSITTNTWHCVVIRRDGDSLTNSLTAWMDGSVGSTQYNTGVDPTSTAAILIGNRPDVNSQCFDGRIAEFAFYDTNLSDQQCKTLSGVHSLPFPSANLKCYLPIYGNSSTEPDLSGNGNNGTVTGTTKANHAPVVRYVSAPFYRPQIALVGSPPATLRPTLIGSGFSAGHGIIG